MVNAVSQVRKGSRGTFIRMMELVELGMEPDSWIDLLKVSEKVGAMTSHGTDLDKSNEDLYAIMVDKAEGEALTRVKGSIPGQGVTAYMSVYKWYTITGGYELTERMRRVMSPPTPKTEADIVDAIEQWSTSVKMDLMGKDCCMSTEFRKIA